MHFSRFFLFSALLLIPSGFVQCFIDEETFENIQPYFLFLNFQEEIENWINRKEGTNGKESLEEALNSMTVLLPWLLKQPTMPPGLDVLELADNILSIHQNTSHLKLVIPLLEFCLQALVPSSPKYEQEEDTKLIDLCSTDFYLYRRLCQDLYAMLIWLYHEIDNDVVSLKYLHEYNLPRPPARQFLDIYNTNRQLPYIRTQSWWNQSDVNLLFLSNIQDNYLIIKNELLTLSNNSLWGPYLDIRLSTNDQWDPYTSWESIPLYNDNKWNAEHCKILINTCTLLKQHDNEFKDLFNRSNYHNLIGKTRIEEDYSEIPSLGIKLYKVWPNSRIKPHMGSPGRLVHSLGLIVPTNPMSTIRVGNVTKNWIEGEFHHFDDSFVHSVENFNENEMRIVLAFVAIHPDLLNTPQPPPPQQQKQQTSETISDSLQKEDHHEL